MPDVFLYPASAQLTLRVPLQGVSSSDSGSGVEAAVPTPLSSDSGSGDISYDNTVLSDGPLASWELAETTGTSATDATGDGYTGTYAGGYTLGQPGPGDGSTAVAFDGASGSQMARASFPATSGRSMTVAIAVNMPSGNRHGGLIKVSNDPGGGVAIGVGDGAAIDSGDDGTTLMITYEYIRDFSTGFTLTPGWHLIHLVLQVNGDPLVYVDGNLVFDGTGGIQALPGTGPVCVGGYTIAGIDRYFNGTVAKAAVYDHQLSAARISAHARAFSSGLTTETVTLTDSDAGSGAEAASVQAAVTATDTASSGADSTVVGLSASDTGSGVEAAIPSPQASEIGSGVETVTITLTASDTGSGADSQTVALTSTDTGSGADSQAISLTVTDVGSGTDAQSYVQPLGLDTGSGAESASIQASVSGSDTAAGTETQSVALTGSDTGSGADSQAMSPSGADSAAAVEQASLAITGADTGSGQDATATIQLSGSDVYSVAEATSIAAVVSSNETGAGTETAKLAVTSTDSAAGGEQASLALGAGESATSATSEVIALGAFDSGSGDETEIAVPVGTTPIEDAELGAGLEDGGLVALAAADLASAIEAELVIKRLLDSDSGGAADNQVAIMPLAADSATGIETLRLALTGAEAGGSSETWLAALGDQDAGAGAEAWSVFVVHRGGLVVAAAEAMLSGVFGHKSALQPKRGASVLEADREKAALASERDKASLVTGADR